MADPRDAVADLRRIAFLLERAHESTYRVRAFRGAAAALRGRDPDALAALAASGELRRVRGVGDVTARCVVESLAGEEPVYLRRMLATEGSDVDEAAVDTCRGLLGTMTSGSKSVRNALERSIVCGDALTMDWTAPFAGVFRERGGFDLVIGNPPFLNQLEAATAHDRSHAAVLKERFGAAATGYADPSALFLLIGSRIARSGAKGLALPVW